MNIKNKCLVATIGFVIGLLVIGNIVLIHLMLKAQETLETHNEIILTVPLELQEKIVSVIQKDTASILSGYLHATDSKLANINSSLVTNSIMICENKALITTLANSMQNKANAFLAAARQNTNDVNVAQLLYASALAHSESKMSVLMEFLNWQRDLIKVSLKKHDFNAAEDRFLSLASVCDKTMLNASVSDVESFSQVKNEIIDIQKEITNQRNRKVSEQKEWLNAVAACVNTSNTYAVLLELSNKVSDYNVMTELEDIRDDILSQISLKQSCVVPHEYPLSIPVLSENFPVVAWLENFNARLNNPIAEKEKIKEIDACGDFLLEVKKIERDDVKGVVAKVENTIHDVCLADWKNRSQECVLSTNENIDVAKALITEAQIFPQKDFESIKNYLRELHKVVIRTDLQEIDNQSRILKSYEDKIAEDLYVQMTSVLQGQFIQILFRLQDLENRLNGGFANKIECVKNKISATRDLITAYNLKMIAKENTRINEQQERYLTAIKQMIEDAKKPYEMAEKLADEILKTRENEKCVKLYKEAWQILIKIHPNDLQSIDPAMHLYYSELKRKIENQILSKLDDSDLCTVEYVRFSDFK